LLALLLTLSGRRIADTDMALVVECWVHRTVFRRTGGAATSLACVDGAGVVVGVAAGAVGLGRIRARSCLRVADACHVALIRSRTGDGVAANADTVLAGISLGTSVAVIAGGAIRFLGVRALTGCRVADSDVVTLVIRLADDRATTDADTGLTGIDLRAGVAIVARRAIWFRRIRARP
jgi:hypothetical protein